MITARLIGKTIVGALFSLLLVISLGFIMILFIGSGDYTVWYVKPLLGIVEGFAAIIASLLLLKFVRGLVTWRSIWATDEMNVIGLLVPLSLLFGVWVNITTGRGELGVFAVGMAGAVLLGVLLALISVLLYRLRRIMGGVREYMRWTERPHNHKQPGH